MSTDDASDVTKALAAFGAPSIRYRSFGQVAGRSAPLVMPRPGAPPVAPVMVEPASVPEPVHQRGPALAPEPARVAPPSGRAAATPLAEWAPPSAGASSESTPLSHALPQLDIPPTPALAAMPPVVMLRAPSPVAGPSPVASLERGRTLAEVFELLASAPAGPAQASPSPELFRRG